MALVLPSLCQINNTTVTVPFKKERVKPSPRQATVYYFWWMPSYCFVVPVSDHGGDVFCVGTLCADAPFDPSASCKDASDLCRTYFSTAKNGRLTRRIPPLASKHVHQFDPHSRGVKCPNPNPGHGQTPNLFLRARGTPHDIGGQTCHTARHGVSARHG